MNKDRLENQFKTFERVLNKLEDLYLDGTIQRFEFVFELSWKLMKGYLEYDGIEANSPRGAFREAFKIELIEDGTAWIKRITNRFTRSRYVTCFICTLDTNLSFFSSFGTDVFFLEK